MTTTLTERLDEAIDGPDPVPSGEGHAWSIDDLGSADWAMRKLAKVEGEIAAAEALVADRVADLNEWLEGERARLETQRENWTSLLGNFHRAQLEDDADRKTIRLPSGTLVARKQPDRVDIPNPAMVLDWALQGQHDEYVRVKEELDRSAVKQAVLKDGEVIPGVSPVPGEVKFSAEVMS